MRLKPKIGLTTAFILLFLVTVGAAEDFSVSPTGGHSDQTVINGAIDAAAKTGGGTVYLTAGTFLVDGPVMMRANIKLTGDPNAIVKVWSGSSQWFTGSIGIISNAENLHNVEVCGFQVDGSVPELPFEYHHSRADTAHDCERCIMFCGDSGNMMNGISIHDMTLYDSLSDGIYCRFADNVHIYNNFISNTQHEGVFWQCCRYSLIENNRVAGITSDCLRLDNCQNCEVRYNLCWSYDGTHSSEAYQHGENGIQIGNSGASHGYDGRVKPFYTLNIYVHHNKFINNGLKGILIDGGLGDVNVYVDGTNEVIGHDQIITSGFPIELIGNYSYEHSPSLATSKQVFEDIFDILNVPFTNSGVTNQTDEAIHYTVKSTTAGNIAGGVKIVGFRNQIIIGNDTFVQDENSAIVKTAAAMAPQLDFWNRGTDKIDKDVSVKFENGTATATLNIKLRWYTVSSIQTGRDGQKSSKKTYHTSTASFSDTVPAPQVFPQPNVTGYVDVYPSETYPKFIVNVPHNGVTQRIEYRYGDSVRSHIFLVGEKKTGAEGVESTIFSRVDRWEGSNASVMADQVIFNGSFNPTELSMSYYTPYGEIPVTDVRVEVHELQKDTWRVPLVGFVVRFVFMVIVLFFLIKAILRRY
jgi:hypothetical protein